MRKAIAIIAYDRFHYFSLVVASILGQDIGGKHISEEYDIYYFQDGFCHEDSRSDKDGYRLISEMIESLSAIGCRFIQTENLGVAFHFDFIERKLFTDLGYDYVVFCEDDMILGPGYMSVMNLMAERFEKDERVGMVSANPENVTVLRDIQRNNEASFAAMSHNWGFGMFANFWKKRQEFVDIYLGILKKFSYRSRPHEVIYNWLTACGFEPAASSQDYVKQCATMALGACRISTFCNFGLYIGRTGLHCNADIYNKLGFNEAVVYGCPLESVGYLSQEQYGHIFRRQSKQMKVPPKVLADGVDVESIHEWQEKLRRGDFAAEKILGSDWEDKVKMLPRKISKIWSTEEIPDTPQMNSDAATLLDDCLEQSNVFLEYGAGGSTILACSKVQTVVSVEADLSFLEAVKGAAEAREHSSRLIMHHADIGAISEWSNPIDPTTAIHWPRYVSSVWKLFQSGEIDYPDVVLIDGRFRVACFLMTLLIARSGTTILFNNYADRPQYHLAERYLKPRQIVGGMAKFVTTDVQIDSGAMIHLVERSTDFG